MATPTVIEVDPFDAATEAKAPSAEYFGECVLDAWNCVLERGTGKRPYNPGVDNPADRRTAVDIVILPIAEQNVKYTLERKLVAESSAWTKVTWPSMQKLGINNAKEARGRFCKVKLTPTGRTWKGQDGSDKTETSFEFLAFYANKAECISAYTGGPVIMHDQAAKPVSSAPVDDDPNKVTALSFAKAIIANLARQEKDLVELQKKVTEKIAAMPMVSKYFTGDSPEIMSLIADAALPF